ncbi:MAG TPA: GNAT family N-acetyltransferase [Chthoniobacteraceae bacterium]|nr:GNAT family N-acetyltransferase [Chthoniobacteraceae bacterium]
MTIRVIRWPEELDAVRDLDTAFTSDRIFLVESDKQSFTLVEQPALPPLRKVYPMDAIGSQILPADRTLVAEHDGAVIGIASMRYEAWNTRAMLRQLYISASHRRMGAGRALVDGIATIARRLGARCLWVETQNTNYPAIRFYLDSGFELCGLDTSLYANSSDPAAEIGLFFAKPLVS